MNILILGEYSGFAKNLKKGFIKLGHNVIIVTDCNGSKKITSDKNDILFNFSKTYYIKGRALPFIKTFNCIYNALLLNFKILKCNKFDLILIVNSEFIFHNFLEDVGAFKWVIANKLNKGGKIILSACSYDPAFYQFQKDLIYSPFLTNNASYTLKYSTVNHNNLFKDVVSYVDLIVPTEFMYRLTMVKYLKDNNINTRISKCIMLPYETDIKNIETEKNDKIIILHGIIAGTNRGLLKGSNHILKGLDLVKKKYPEKVSIVVPKDLGFDEYMKIFKSADIVIDQTYSYGFGMNAVIALSYGKVLLGGNEPEYKSCLEIHDIPVINILPDENQIFLELEKLILDRNRIETLKIASRKFALENISCEIVAAKYIELLKTI